VSSENDTRQTQAAAWVQHALNQTANLIPLAGDASFRRYFRVQAGNKAYVLMDAPPEREDVSPFLAVRDWMEKAGLRVPQKVAGDVQQGFLLLEDFGDTTWAVHVDSGGDVAPLFSDALRQLHLLQNAYPEPALAVFDVARMQRECDLYLDWYLPNVAKHNPSQAEREVFHASFLPLLEEISALPRVPVHLDYHSRNLMLAHGNVPKQGAFALGVIDFQDAVSGPLTYDLASLLYDCYQDYDESLRRDVSEQFFATLPEAQQAYFNDIDDWHRALRLTAMQRHIKAIGIFSRLAFRDGKKQFLDEIPLTRKHLREELAVLDVFANQNATTQRLLAFEPAQ